MVRICSNRCKRILTGVVMLFGITSPSAHALNVFACEPEWAALVKVLAPEADLYVATTAKQDPHMVQARPSLIAKMRRADLFVCSGASLEIGWLPALQMKANNPKLRDSQPGAFYAAEQVETLDQLENVSRLMGDVHPEGNPHIHLDPRRLLQIAEALTKRLSSLDPKGAEQYRRNLEQFSVDWQQAMQRWQQQAEPLKGKRVVAYHTSFRYLFDWLGMDQVADLEPKPGLPPTSGHLAGLLQQLEGQTLLAVVITGFQDPKAAEWLSERIDVPVMQLPSTVEQVDQEQALFAYFDNLINQLTAEASR